MKYPYPKLNRAVCFRRIGEDEWNVADDNSPYSCVCTYRQALFIRRLDGFTDPYAIDSELSREEVDELLEVCREGYLTRRKRVVFDGVNLLFPLLEYRKSRRLTALLRIVYFFVLWLWLPVLITGMTAFFSMEMPLLNLDGITAGSIVGLVVGMVFHEAAHAAAAVTYGAEVSEVGLMLQLGLFPGAYVSMDYRRVKSCLKRIGIVAAGVECNFLLGGLGLWAAVLFPAVNGFLLFFGLVNLILACLNFIMIGGLDGERILGLVLGEGIGALQAVSVLFSKGKRRRLLAQGLDGLATWIACWIRLLVSLVYPLLCLLGIMEVVMWIF